MGRKEPFYLFVGDLHVGSIEAVTLPAEVRNDRQKWLAQGWADLVKRTKAEAKTKSLRLMLGGDLVDLANIVDAQEIAVELLRPLANVADEVWGVYGTPYHVGEDGVEDRSIYGQLGARGARRAHHHWLDTGDGLLTWAHHGMPMSRDPWNELNGHKQLAERTYWSALQHGIGRVGYLVRHHVHRSPQGSPVSWRGVQVAVCPCWKMPDGFSGKFAPGLLPTIGALALRPGGRGLELWTYEIPRRLA